MKFWNFWFASYRHLFRMVRRTKLFNRRFAYTFFITVRIKSHILVYALTLALLSPLAAVIQPSSTPQFKSQIDKAKSLRDTGSSDEARKIYESVLPPLRSQPPSQELVDTLN